MHAIGKQLAIKAVAMLAAVASTVVVLAPTRAQAAINPPAGGPFVIQQVETGRCLDVFQPLQEGSQIVTAPCTRSRSQQWFLQEWTNGDRRIQNARSNLCLNVVNASQQSGHLGRVIQFRCGTHLNEQWRFQLFLVFSARDLLGRSRPSTAASV